MAEYRNDRHPVANMMRIPNWLHNLSKWPGWARHAGALALVAVAFFVVDSVRSNSGMSPTAPYLAFLPAVLLAAVLFDHRSSIVATLVSGVLSIVFIAPVAHSLAEVRRGDVVAIILLIGTGLAIAAIVERLRHAVDDLSNANVKLVHAMADNDRRMRLFNAVLEGTPDPVYVKDGDGRFVHVNEASAALLGSTIDAVIGKRDRDFLTPEMADGIEAADRAILASGVGCVVEERVAIPGGPVTIFLSSKFPWTDSDGAVLGLIGISRDITDRKDAEIRLRSSDAQKELLLDDINHRIKNHLQTVGGLMTVAGRRALTAEDAQEVIADGVSRLSVLAQVYTRLQLSDHTATVDARGFITELCNDLAKSLTGVRPIAIRVDAQPVPLGSGLSVTIGLVINELVNNALKYAFPDDRAGEVQVSFRRRGDDFELAVADNGIGFDTDAQPVGTGNGRRLVRGMVQQLGGTLAIDSDAGSRFTLTFPVTVAAHGPS